MSIDVMSWVWNHSQSEGGSDRFVLLAIADHAAADGSNAWPSIHTLCRKTGLSARTVQRSIRRLTELGELRVETQRGGTPEMPPEQRPNRYTVVMTPRQDDTPPGVTVAPTPRQDDTQTILEPSLIETSDSLMDEFDEWYRSYPRKAQPSQAKKAWRAKRRQGVTSDQLTSARDSYLRSLEPGIESKFVKHPASLINQWEDFYRPDEPPIEESAPAIHHPPAIGRCSGCGHLEWDCTCGLTFKDPRGLRDSTRVP